MTSFAVFPHTTMPSHDFDLYAASNDSYPADVMATAEAYHFSNPFFDTPFAAAMSTLDSSAAIYAPSHVPRSADLMATAHALKDPCTRDITPPAVHSFDNIRSTQQVSAAAEPNTSLQTSASSILASASPALRAPQHAQAHYDQSWALSVAPGLIAQQTFTAPTFEHELEKQQPGCVDPSLINPFGSPNLYSSANFHNLGATASPRPPFIDHPPSPAPSHTSNRSQTFTDSRRFKSSGSQSPFLHNYAHQPYPQQYPGQRRTSQASIHSRQSNASQRSGSSYELDDESIQRGLCPIPDCGRVFKDLKAHMLTHQNERPEKCPIVTCEYHVKGFARKYDKNRHTLTHYKGTMVCGFCPGSGSAAEKSFNRADVFKRHLTSVHGVEQTPPNSKKKSPHSASKKGFNAVDSKPGTCSTCGVTFSNVQEFYEHLDDCVMRVVQQTDPCEAINQKNLGSVQDDTRVQETLERHSLPQGVTDYTADNFEEGDEDDEDDEQVDNDEAAANETYSSKNPRAGKGGIKSRKDGQASS